ncbi:MAG: amylo-alpha,6-glucosidase [Cyanobacteria bacterium RYN_339]|nr:amylo-alpha,6-glucosidase [Cyanobacteria bacterium RYN_339]
MPETKIDIPASLPVLGADLPVDIELTGRVAAAKPALAPVCTHTRQAVKHGDVFVVSHTDGQLHPGCECGQGVYYHDTRFLSGLTMALEGRPPIVLGFTAEHNFFSRVEATNEAWILPDGTPVRRESLHLEATRVVDGGVQERIQLTNFNPFPVKTTLALELRSDFKDIFEVRGFFGKQQQGTFLRPRTSATGAELLYQGADGAVRHTRIGYDREAAGLTTHTWAETHETGVRIVWDVDLPAKGGTWAVALTLTPCIDGAGATEQPPPPIGLARLEAMQAKREAGLTRVTSSNLQFQGFVSRGVEDLLTLCMPTADGLFPTAGIPWYCCPFGRDSLITALQALPLSPGFAVATLKYLAEKQGTKLDPYHEEAPGKILHELRRGELAALGEIPFSTYYGTIDATPLWLVLFAETYRWTGDMDLVRALWPNALRALAWIDQYGDIDGDGFVEYARSDEKGLANQGWKDSHDSIIHPDAEYALAPIALAEVQGYVYDAKRRLAGLARLMDDAALADVLEAQAATLKQRFNEAFWLEDEGYYAVALDGHKQPVRSKTSNPGHCLWSDLIAEDRVGQVIDTMLAPDMFNGWGIRTMASSSPNYNPISYHNGTVWPHDVSLIVRGMADRGRQDGVSTVFTGLFEASKHFEYQRLPELFCGFDRQSRFAKPVPYPVACSPQAWAAGTPLHLLAAALGLAPDGANNVLRVAPVLPAWLGDVRLTGLRVGTGSVDLAFRRGPDGTTCEVLAADGVRVEVG